MSDIADALNRLNELGRPDLAEPIHFLMGERDGLMKALSAAKTVIESKDKAYSLIQQRWDAMAAKAATVDSERECNERLTAEIDTLRAQLSEAQARLAEIEGQEPVDREAVLAKAEELIGVGAGAWDTVNSLEIVGAILEAAGVRHDAAPVSPAAQVAAMMMCEVHQWPTQQPTQEKKT